MDQIKREQLVNIENAAKMLGVHKETLRRWDRQGILKAVRIGRRGDRRYLPEDIQKIIEQNTK